MANPTVFISYSWDSDAHKDWVRQLADRLLAAGIEVTLDQYDVRKGHNLQYFMEQSVTKVGKVLLILTENYKLKAEQRAGGTGAEYSMITAEWYGNQTQAKNIKYIPIVRGANRADCVPPFVSSMITHDMHNDATFEADLKHLIHEIYDEPAVKKPAVGGRPAFLDAVSTNDVTTPTSAETTPPALDINKELADKQAEYEHAKQVRQLQEQVREAVSDGETEEALYLVKTYAEKKKQKDLLKQITTMQGNLTKLEKSKRIGILSEADARAQTNGINYNLLGLVGDLE